MAITFNWKVLTVDPLMGTMVVSYVPENQAQAVSLNIPQPPSGVQVNDHIASFAPITSWQASLTSFEPVEHGQEGTGVIDLDSVSESETPNFQGSWNEEYMRALIYQVLEEIKESEV